LVKSLGKKLIYKVEQIADEIKKLNLEGVKNQKLIVDLVNNNHKE
jgi:hypothetical protein